MPPFEQVICAPQLFQLLATDHHPADAAGRFWQEPGDGGDITRTSIRSCTVERMLLWLNQGVSHMLSDKEEGLGEQLDRLFIADADEPDVEADDDEDEDDDDEDEDEDDDAEDEDSDDDELDEDDEDDDDDEEVTDEASKASAPATWPYLLLSAS